MMTNNRFFVLAIAALATCPSLADSVGVFLSDTRASQATRTEMTIRSGEPTSAARLRFVLSTLQKFKKFADGGIDSAEKRHDDEEKRIQASLISSEDPSVRQALNLSIQSNEQSLLETKKIYQNMAAFSDSMASFVSAANSKGSACEQTSCGINAGCTDTTDGAQCVCKEGYVGLGEDCHPPPEFRPHRIMLEGQVGVQTQAGHMSVCVFETNSIAIVFNDASRGMIGRIIVGSVREGGLADLAPPEQFTAPGGKAYNPVVQGSADKRILVAWRDENRGGTGWIRAAEMGVNNVVGADLALAWGSPTAIANDQAHKMAVVPLPNSRFAVLYSDKVAAQAHTPAESFGSSLLLQVGAAGVTTVVGGGSIRFTDSAVCRLEVTRTSLTSFVVAARASPALDDMDQSQSVRQEAMAIYAEVDGDNLVFDPNAVNIEPSATGIWARGVSLIDVNTFAYAYQVGENTMKIAVVEITRDPQATSRMNVVHAPAVVRTGFSKVVNMLSVPYTTADPHTLTYYESGDHSYVNICTWTASEKRLHECEDFMWLGEKTTSVAGVHLGGGKAFMVFSTAAGTPYYTVFGLSKK